MEPDGDPPPFWSPSSATILRQQRRRRDPSPIISPVSLILLLPILALLIIFFLLPPFLSTTSQLLRPTYSVKKSWDSFNVLLVVFAILCGVFARRNAEEAPEDGDESAPAPAAVSAAEAGSSDRVSFSGDAAVVDRNINEHEAVRVAGWFDGGGGGRLRRNSSSYPDLRQQDLQWETGETRYRYYDDIDVDLYRQPAGSVELNRRARREEGGVRVIPVDTFEVHSIRPPSPSPDPPPKAPTPPPPPPPPVNSKPRQPLHSVPRKHKAEKAPDENRSTPPMNSKPRQLRRRNREAERVRFESNVAAETKIEKIAAPLPEDPPPPPPTQVVEVERFSERRLQRKKSGAKELATAIASLYTDRKRKKKLKRKNISESSSESSPTNVLPHIPPPPPPPPPAKVFQNLFKKSTKHKRVHSVAAMAPPPPPPPPPPSSIFNNIFKTGKSKRFSNINISTSSAPPPPPPPPPPSSILNTIFKQGSKSRRHRYETRAPPPPPPPPPAQSGRKSRTNQAEPPSTPPEPSRRRTQASWKPPLPAKSHSYYDEYLNSGAQSPLVPLPPPPPPPFKMPDFKFVARGDFVRILSAHSSRCSSPERADLEDVELMSVKSSEGGDSMAGPGPGPFCPSPDVNLKADSFIARLKGEWRMDKMKSIRERET